MAIYFSSEDLVLSYICFDLGISMNTIISLPRDVLPCRIKLSQRRECKYQQAQRYLCNSDQGCWYSFMGEAVATIA